MSNLLKKGLVWVLITLILLPTAALLTGASHSKGANSLPWTTDYSLALERSKAEGKPVLLFFTGSDWCTWCTRLETEVFETSTFIDSVKDKYIFVELDFPHSTPIAADVKAQNKKLQEKYAVKGYPTVIIVDGEGQKVVQTGYEAGGGKFYANHLDKLVSPHLAKFAKGDKSAPVAMAVNANTQKVVKAVTQESVDIELIALKGMTAQSRSRALSDELAKSLPDQNFLRAAYLIMEEGSQIKEKLLALDPNHEQGTSYFLSFADYVKQGESVQPLIAFVEKVGEKDKANLWKAEWTIAKGYQKAGDYEKAMKWAEKSIAHAPDPSKTEVQTWISSVKQVAQQDKVALEANVEQI